MDGIDKKSLKVGQSNEDLESKRKAFGENLKRLRELRGYSRKDIIHLTKIAPPFIEGLEEGNIEKLPGHVFGRGFLQSICKTLDIESKEMIEAYNELCLGSQDLQKTTKIGKAKIKSQKGPAQPVNTKILLFGGGALAVALGLMLVVVISIYSYQKSASNVAHAPQTTEETAVVTESAASPESAAAQIPVPVDAKVLEQGSAIEVEAQTDPLVQTSSLEEPALPESTKTQALPEAKASPEATDVRGMANVELEVSGQDIKVQLEKDGETQEVILKSGKHRYQFKSVLDASFDNTDGLKVHFNGRPLVAEANNEKVPRRIVLRNSKETSKKTL